MSEKMKRVCCAAMAFAAVWIGWAKPVLVFNEDDSHFFGSPAHANEAALNGYIDRIAASGHVTHFFMCPNAMRANFDSKVFEPAWAPCDVPGWKQTGWSRTLKTLHDKGIDPYVVWTKRCREKGVSPWLSMRMNDVHFVNDPTYGGHSRFWREHPAFWREPNTKSGAWNRRALDFAHEEVRKYALAFVEELLARYDVDGLECDWMRFPDHLTVGRERELAPCLNAFMGEVRRLANQAAVRYGHPVQVAARVDSDPEAALARGTDAFAWAKAGSVDWIVPCNFFSSVDFALPFAAWKSRMAAANPAVRVIPGLDAGVMIKGVKDRRMLTVPEYRGWAHRVYGEGAEGIYLFNLFTHGDTGEVMNTILVEGLAPETVSAKEKSIPANAVRECEAFLKEAAKARLAPAMDVLPLGSVQPEGWLKTQLQLQAEGLTGYAEELYDDIGKSDWLTGANVGKEFAWERGPYYAKGLVSLAFVLNDDALKAKAKRWVDAILASQRANGDFGPKARNWWANMIALWLVRDWCEATGDPRVEPFLARYFAFQRMEFAAYPLAVESKWAVARAGDELDVVLWLYRRTGRSEWLDFARTVSAQSADWTTFYYRGGDPAGPNANGCRSHIVNFMQGLKTPALQSLLDGDARKRNAYMAAFDAKGWVMKMCGRPDRMINGSEPMVDRSASQGTELCAIAERILSCQTVLAATGLLPAADDLEMVAYNSLPATLGADGRGLRYYCLLNQPSCEDKFLLFANNGGSGESANRNGAICPGPHAGFGCCRSNFHFAWPKFVQSMWMRRGTGLAAIAYGPCRLETTIAGRRVVIVQETGYPFDGKIALRIVEGGGTFPLYARVPVWSPLADAGQFRTFDREWKVGDRIELEFPMPVTTSLWAGDAVAVQRGPLLFALRPESEERIVPRYRVPFEKRWIENGGGAFPRKEILPKSPWGYALVLNADRYLPQADVVGAGTNLQIRVKAVKTDFGGWGYMRDVTTGRAVDPPASPLPDEGAPVETIGLVPMGCAQIRITLFPWLEKKGGRE